jgi:hypothetical protein
MYKPKTKVGVSGALVFAGLVLTSFIVARIATSQNNMNSRHLTTSTKQEEPTAIQENILSAKQKVHSKLFKHHGPKLRDIATTRKGAIEVEEEVGFVIDTSGSTPNVPVLQSAVENADAIVVGVLKSKSSQLTEEGNFIFTDYEMAVEEVIKNNSTSPMQINGLITVTRDGGSVEIKGRIFTAKRQDFKPTFVGNRYLFFLRFIPETGSYLTYGNGAFELKDDKVSALGNTASKELLNAGSKDATAFLNEVRAFVTK